MQLPPDASPLDELVRRTTECYVNTLDKCADASARTYHYLITARQIVRAATGPELTGAYAMLMPLSQEIALRRGFPEALASETQYRVECGHLDPHTPHRIMRSVRAGKRPAPVTIASSQQKRLRRALTYLSRFPIPRERKTGLKP